MAGLDDESKFGTKSRYPPACLRHAANEPTILAAHPADDRLDKKRHTDLIVKVVEQKRIIREEGKWKYRK